MTNELSNEDKLRRLLYLSDYHETYTAGNPDRYSLPSIILLPCGLDYYVTHVEEFLKLLTEISDSNTLPKRSTLFYIIGRTLKYGKLEPSDRHAICSTVLKLCQTDEDFFDFIKYITTFRFPIKTKLPTCLRKTIKRFYSDKSAEDLVKSYVNFKSRHDWSHKTLFKLIHYKPDSPLKSVIVKQIMFKNVSIDKIDDDYTKKLLKKLKNIDQLRTSKNVDISVELIEELQVNHHQLNGQLQKQAQVWEAVLPQMTTREILMKLPKLYKHGFLKTSKQVTTCIIECLTNLEKVKASNIHPIEVFIHQRNFEKGGRPIDPKLYNHLVNEKKLAEEKLAKLKEPIEPKCPPVMNSIHRCMTMSYHNVKSTNKKFLIVIDVTEKMETPCIHNKNITAIEAALSIAMFYAKVEKDVTIATYNDKDIKLFNLNKGDHFGDILKKLKEQKSTYLLPLGALEWALQKKKNYDVIFSFIHSSESFANVPKEIKMPFDPREKTHEVIKKYRETINKNAKFVFYNLSYKRMGMVQNMPGAIHVVGLDNEVPKLLHAFITGKFC